jgi:putative drug exporter of the RND superfamily
MREARSRTRNTASAAATWSADEEHRRDRTRRSLATASTQSSALSTHCHSTPSSYTCSVSERKGLLVQLEHNGLVVRIARFAVDHRRMVLVSWLVLAAVGLATSGATSSALSNRFTVPGEAARTNAQVLARFGGSGGASPIVSVVRTRPGEKATSPAAVRALRDALQREVRALPGARVVSYASTRSHAFVSSDGRTTFALLYPPGDNPTSDTSAIIRRALAGATVAGGTFNVTSYGALRSGGGASGGIGVLPEVLIGAVGALLVLAFVFGSFLALIPLAMALFAIPTTFLALWGLTTVTSVSSVVQFLVALIGLGVAIDYSLLIVTRWRDERLAGLDNNEAVIKAIATAGRTVMFSGVTVGIGLLALVALPVGFVRSIGLGGLLIPVVSVFAALTALPALLSLVGPRLDWPRIRRGNSASRAWRAWSTLVIRRRWVAALVAVALLAVLAAPVASLRVGSPDADALAQSGSARAGLLALERAGLGRGVISPYVALTSGSPEGLARSLSHVKGIQATIAPPGRRWRSPTASELLILPKPDAVSRDTLVRLRRAAEGTSRSSTIGGQAAESQDFVRTLDRNAPTMIALIALVTYVLLARAFRSLLLPLKAILLNLISVAAALGVVVFIWQDGHGSSLIWNVPATGSVTEFVPLMVFAFLYGLSMDYEVFILARIREEYDQTHSTDEAGIRGLSHTGRLVTSAALILFLAFAALAAAPGTDVKVFATGLGAGILIDATIVRALLVPALVSLLGRWNWWLPSIPARLLRVEPSA